MAADVKLSKRLTAIAEMVNAAGFGEQTDRTQYCLCDVGTDHAHIPIRLLMDGVIGRAIAMDVIEGPLEKARGNIELYGVADKVTLRISDGLDAYKPGEAQGLVIAGMGGRIMSRILLREPDKTRDFDEIILQPQADPEFVRRAVRELGLFIDREKIVLEDNKYYPVMHVSRIRCAGPDWKTGADHNGDDAELLQEAEDLFGPVLIRDRDSMLRSYLLWQKGVNDRIMYSLQKANNAETAAIREKRAEVARKERLIRKALEYFEIVG
ncbi:MAG: SAM-dependent methyltransferase [Lachnospiraceae bacterium]|nr:SAM-dependent methyltransferase [Lachnospiraceae bacterium]